MNAKKYLAALAAVFMVMLTSCDSSEVFIQAQTQAANMQCPMSLGSGLTMVSVEYNGPYVVYNVQGDESMYLFSQDLATDAMKDQIANTLRAQAALDKNVAKFIKALKEKHVGVIYHYYTDSSAMDVVVYPSRL